MMWTASLVAIELLLATGAAAQERRQVSVPSEDASIAIPALARQSGLQVLVPAEEVRGVRTNAVNGAYSPQEALDRMLAGTGLVSVRTGENTIAVRRANPAANEPPGEAGAPLTGTSTVSGVVVTGSRIKRAGFDTLEAALSTNAKQIEARGYDNVAQALQDTPGFGVPGSSPLSSSQARLGIAQSFANFFGLGSQRTLTLVDGQRFVSSNSVQPAGSNTSPGGQVDLNLIPVGLIDHVETVAIGGAPVYGSDAIAGTVNIILKQHFDGVQASAQYGITDLSDAESYNVRLLAGKNFDNNRGNVIFGVEYDHQAGLVFSGRSGLPFAFPNPANTGPHDGIPANVIEPNITFPFATEGGLPYNGSILNYPGIHYPGLYPNGNYIFANGQPMQFAPDGELVPFNVGRVVSASSGIPIESSSGDGVNAANHFSLLSPTKRVLLNFNGHYDLTPNVRFFFESSYAHTEGTLLSDITSLDAANLFSPGAYTLKFSVNNPFLSQQARNIIASNGLTTFELSRNLNDVVDRNPATSTEDVYRIVAGFDGKLHAWGEDLSWNVAANYGQSDSITHDTYINPTNLLAAANAVSDGAGGVVCANAAANPGCVPIDLFGQNAFSAAAAKYVSEFVEAKDHNTQASVTANLSGRLPFGISDRVSFNVGYEHRRETGSFSPDAGWVKGDVLDLVPGYGAVAGSFDTNELYGETVVPVISDHQDLPLIKSLSFEGAFREIFETINAPGVPPKNRSDPTWSAGGRLLPRLPGWGDGLEFRGVYTHSIREPAISEFALPQTGGFVGITDPCDAANVNTGVNPTVRYANCKAALSAAAGTPVDPNTFHSSTRATSQTGVTGGNPNLVAETADSWSAGFVYQPRLLRRFRFSLDWSDISLQNGIQELTINTALDACYDSPAYPNVPTCTAFQRLTPSTIGSDPKSSLRKVGDIAPGFTQTYFNVATINFAGLIAAAEYSFDVNRLGTFSLGSRLFYSAKYDLLPFPGQPLTHEAGTIASPRERLEVNAGWAYRRFETDWQVEWTSKSSIASTCTIELYANCYVSSYVLVNSTFSYQITPRLRAQIVIDNLFNKQMPAMALFERLFSTYDPLGRRYLFRLTASF